MSVCMSPATVSNLNKMIYAKIDAWLNRPIFLPARME